MSKSSYLFLLFFSTYFEFRKTLTFSFLNLCTRSASSLALSWFVNTNEDVGDFRLELASLREAMPKTVLVKDIGYNTR
jgi:hypothetical protein